MHLAVGPRWKTVAALMAGSALVAMLSGQRGTPGSWLPHGYCFTWNPTLLWTHVVSDSLIGIAYVSIPITLLHLVRKRTDMPFNWIFVLFAIFIVSCGATHWVEVWTVWNPDYWLSANIKVITAVASVLTAAALVRLVPGILAIPTVAQLTAAKSALEVEVANRQRVEEALLRERAELERRVLERTEALARATAAAKADRAAAEEANKLKDRFLAKVSHELRTPLQSTLSWAQVLQHAALDPARATQAADRIMHNVRSQARLIDDLLDISRILSGKLKLELKPVDAAQVIGKAAEVVRSASASRGIGIEVAGSGDGTLMHTDPVRLEQVVWNLVNNAVQATPDGGRVRVGFHADGAALLIEVRDWGRGIAPADLPHVFEPFRQGPGGDNTHRGLGLGLAITRSIVELFGGQLRAHSDGLGQGATFSLRLPMAGADSGQEAVPGAGLSDEERRRLHGLRVLYVEDEQDIAEGGRLMLSALGARVDLCLSFDEARQRILAGGFDVLLSDLNLGQGRSALDLLGFLRGLAHGRSVPAIVLSAYGSPEDQRQSRVAGFARHLVKPVEATEVARALIGAVGHGPIPA